MTLLRGGKYSEATLSALAACLLLAALLGGCAAASSPSGQKAQSIYKEGKKALAEWDTEGALLKFKSALKISEAQKLHTNLHAIALTHIERLKWRQALTYMERALAADREILRRAKQRPATTQREKLKLRLAETKVASDLNDLARLHCRLGEPEATLKRLGELLAINLRLGRERGAAITHNNIGRILFAMDEVEKTSRHYLVALALFIKVKEESRAETVRRNLRQLELRRRRVPSPKP